MQLVPALPKLAVQSFETMLSKRLVIRRLSAFAVSADGERMTWTLARTWRAPAWLGGKTAGPQSSRLVSGDDRRSAETTRLPWLSDAELGQLMRIHAAKTSRYEAA
jgi:hypothetical protein